MKFKNTCAIAKAIIPPTIIDTTGMSIDPTTLSLIFLVSLISNSSRPLGIPSSIDNIETKLWVTADKMTILQKAPPTEIKLITGSSGNIPSIVWPTLLNYIKWCYRSKNKS